MSNGVKWAGVCEDTGNTSNTCDSSVSKGGINDRPKRLRENRS